MPAIVTAVPAMTPVMPAAKQHVEETMPPT
jgi:hypothetical protein